MANTAIMEVLRTLNPQQHEAATHGDSPLLIVAGAGTGKTMTLVHRVAWQIAQGVDPSRILLLTFTRRAAGEMIRRASGILRQLAKLEKDAGTDPAELTHLRSTRVWGGTFHAISTRLLRRFGKAIDLPSEFTIHDRSDSEDFLNVLRTELALAKTDKRFPKKGTCMSIYSRCVNSQQRLPKVLKDHFPWCAEWESELKQLFNAYIDRKESCGVLDYDDLLLFWHALLQDPAGGEKVRKLFDCVLVDEYQDTNALQAEILYGLCPDGRGLTVVGDDAQSIYAFRAADVRNILDFPKQFDGTHVVTLEQNYRSSPQILDVTNEVIAQAKDRFTKNLWSKRADTAKPSFLHCRDEDDQTEFLVRQILTHREEGIDLRRQAVLFRASHHSMNLEAELARRKIPFHKYGGLKFVETAHVKDLMAFMRLAENPRDIVSGIRVLPLLPGIGPKRAQQLMAMLQESGGSFEPWKQWKPPKGCEKLWGKLISMLDGLQNSEKDLPSQVHQIRKFYTPILEEKYDHASPRLRDLEQLEQIASRYRSRRRMLQEITLDPPASTQDLAGPPHLDDDYLILSTIHSAKGLEWDAVYVIHAADGNIPSDMATKNRDEIDEERRLFYVGLTRAKSNLYVTCPLRYYHFAPGVSDRHSYAQRSRFLTDPVMEHLQARVTDQAEHEETSDSFDTEMTSRKVRRRLKDRF